MRQHVLERAIGLAIDAGHLRTDTDPQQMLFEIHGLILALHHDARFLRRPGADARARAGFENVLSHYLAAPATAGAIPSPVVRRKRSAAPA